MPRRRLDQVDAMRPIKQLGVVSTHSIMYFAPAAASVGSGAALLLLHVSRDGFFFLSACMLTYAYTEMRIAGLGRFYWRRFVSVGLPYLCWNFIYFLHGLPGNTYASPAAALAHLGRLIDTGYYQLYFLLVIMQFYLVFPLVLVLLRRTRGHHGLVIAAAALAQVTVSIMTHWNLLPTLMERYAQQDALSYVLYLIGGGVVAFHIDEVDAWVRRHAELIMALTLVAALGAEGIYLLSLHGVTSALGSGNDPFQPSVIPFNIGAITCGYLAGVVLVQPWRSRLTKTLVRVGSDDAYGIYLSQMLFISLLISFGWGRLNSVLPWPVVCLLAVGIIFACCITLTTLLARTPLAVPLTGRKQQPWSTLIPRRTPTPTTAARATAAETTAARTAPDQRQERSSALISEWIAQAADHRGSAPYLEDAAGAETVSYAELRQATRAWARRLDRAGIAPGGAVAIRWPDPLGYATALVAILGAGRVAVPLDPAAPAAELARVLAVARPEVVVAASAEGLPPGLAVLGPPDEPDRADGAAGTDGAADLDPDGAAGTDGAAGAGGIFLCTSGTTGTPKGILLSQDQLAHVAAAVAGHHRLTPADRGYCCLPLFHVNAEVVGLLATLAARACLVLDRKFSRRGFWPLIGERQITWINAVPAIIAVLAMDPPGEGVGGRIRFVRSASAPLPPSTMRRFEEAFGIPVVETYGMTEAASMITANPVDGPRKPGSAGRAAGAEVRVAERAGSGYLPCPAGTVGRVQIRGRGVIRAYASGAPAGAIDPEGWLDTGDLGHLDQDGYLFLAGRSDDVINRGGEKIYPGEIEDFLLTQPGVGSVAVVAARDEVLGYCPVAYVVPAGSGRDRKLEPAGLVQSGLEQSGLEQSGLEQSGLEAALREACAAALARAKQPSAFYLVQELPLGPTGKVARRRLRELTAAS